MASRNLERRQVREIHRSQPGAPPGTLSRLHQGETSIQVIAYGEHGFERWENAEIQGLEEKTKDFDVVWVNFVGLADVTRIESLGEKYGINRLTLEDIVNVHHMPKFESFDHYDYFVVRMARFEGEVGCESVVTDQLSIILIDKFVITFQPTQDDCLDPVRQRIKEGTGMIRERTADYLAYALIDSVVDHYFPILDLLADRVAEIDDAMTEGDAPVSMKAIHHLRRQFSNLSRHVRPHREMISRLLREPSRFSESTRLFIGDCFDHVLQLSELIDVNREICNELRSYRLALAGNRANEVMKTLTIVSTIFIPLSFITGLYGMNFINMPELKWKFGYFLSLGLMVGLTVGMLIWFRKKGWFDS